MALSASGSVSFSQIQAEHGGSHPISLKEYYRDGGFVLSNNPDVPASGEISADDLRGTTLGKSLVIEVIGAGGGGGYGTESPTQGTGRAGSGQSSSVSLSGSWTVSSSGAQGGRNGVRFKTHGTDGGASFYGSGGARGLAHNNVGGGDASDAPASHYGAGGGGAGADLKNGFDFNSGNAGEGGDAATRATSTKAVDAGSSITILIGKRGAGTNLHNDGGDGAHGYAKITIGNSVNEFTYSGTSSQKSHTFTVPT